MKKNMSSIKSIDNTWIEAIQRVCQCDIARAEGIKNDLFGTSTNSSTILSMLESYPSLLDLKGPIEHDSILHRWAFEATVNGIKALTQYCKTNNSSALKVFLLMRGHSQGCSSHPIHIMLKNRDVNYQRLWQTYTALKRLDDAVLLECGFSCHNPCHLLLIQDSEGKYPTDYAIQYFKDEFIKFMAFTIKSIPPDNSALYKKYIQLKLNKLSNNKLTLSADHSIYLKYLNEIHDIIGPKPKRSREVLKPLPLNISNS